MSRETGQKIELSQKAKQELAQLAKGHKTEQQIAKRARIILGAAAGQTDVSLSSEEGVGRKTVYNWRQRWLSLALIPLSELSVKERLEDLPRPGAPPRISATQRCQLEALACEAPALSGRPISQWSGREIAAELMKREIVETISPRHAARLLKRCLDTATPDQILAEHTQR